ncbi:MAG: cyclic nucleotide-binding domain-containing protein [Ghiorsea sp.]|nr:cyclic nucleotide-binding domain-containing protein [Ghiorsea sp.]MDQ7057601.1 cyclic nucleotide-binding domain-containing protein [Ghiorsea sp.]
MSGSDYIIDDSSNTFRAAMAAEEAGEYEKAYRLFGELWESEFWSEDRDVLLHYANASEHVGDHTRALNIYTKLMESMTLNPSDTTGTLIQASMSRLNELVHDGSVESEIEGHNLDVAYDEEEARLVDELFKYATELSLPAGTTICESEDIANHMWLLVDGQVDVLIANINTTTLTGSRTHPCLMGEVAYFTGMRRAATLKCASDVKLLELSFNDIVDLESKDPNVQPLLDHVFRSRLGYHLLSQHDIFKKLDDDERKEVALCMRHTSYLPSKILVEQGLPRDNAFMVQSGTLLMLKKGEDGNFELISSMHPGDIFHLGGLLVGFRAPYRVVTGTPCRLLRLKAELFEPMMKKHPWLIKDILAHSREEAERQILHPEKENLWAANRYINLDKNGTKR